MCERQAASSADAASTAAAADVTMTLSMTCVRGRTLFSAGAGRLSLRRKAATERIGAECSLRSAPRISYARKISNIVAGRTPGRTHVSPTLNVRVGRTGWWKPKTGAPPATRVKRSRTQTVLRNRFLQQYDTRASLQADQRPYTPIYGSSGPAAPAGHIAIGPPA